MFYFHIKEPIYYDQFGTFKVGGKLAIQTALISISHLKMIPKSRFPTMQWLFDGRARQGKIVQ